MPIPNPAETCFSLDVGTGLPLNLNIDLGGIDLSMLSAFFPGGAQLQISGPGIPNPGDLVGKLLASANAALAPLIPIFNIIDALLSAKAIFDATLSLDPIKIGKVIPDFKAKLDKLLPILPQLSVPCLIKSLVTLLVVYFVGMRAELQAIIDAQSRIDLAVTRSQELGCPALAQLAACAQGNLAVQLAWTQNNGKPLNRLIAILNRLNAMVGLPEIPTVVDLGSSAEEMLAPIDELIKALNAIRQAIPC